MGLSVSGDSGTEQVASPVAVHAVMHNLFLQECCVTTICYSTSTGQRLALALSLQEWTVDSYAKIESGRLKNLRKEQTKL